MSDETVPPTPPSATPPPPPHGGGTAPPPPGPPSATPPGNSDRQLMIVLAYLWVLVLVPYLTQKEDEEVQWHSRQGIVLSVAELIAYVVLGILTSLPAIGCIVVFFWAPVALVFLVLRIIPLVKGLQGERWPIPFLSDYTSMVPR